MGYSVNEMSLEEVINGLKEFRTEIIAILKANKWSHFSKYFAIRENFNTDVIDSNFRKVFCDFYRMNGARGLNLAQKKRFFELLVSGERSLEKIMATLFEIVGSLNRHKLFLSFGTKLIHTIDHDFPIYDTNIAHVLRLTAQKYPPADHDRITNRLQIYDELKNDFKVLLKNLKIKRYLRDVRKEIKMLMSNDGLEWKSNLISDTKLLDSLLWALSPVVKKAISSFPKLNKEESAFSERMRVTERFSKHYVQFGMPLRTQIAKTLMAMAHSKINPESKLSDGKIDVEGAIKHYLKACEYLPSYIHTSERLRRSLGLPEL